MITNKLSLIGRLTKDCNFNIASQSGKEVARFSLAVERTYKDANNEKIVDFFDLKAFGSTAKFIADYTGKGDLIAVDCHLINDNYEKDGQKIYRNSIIVDEVRILYSMKKSQQQPQASNSQPPHSQSQGQHQNTGANYVGQPQYGQPNHQYNYGGNAAGYGGGNQYPHNSQQQYQYPGAQNGMAGIEDDLPF